MDQAIVKNPTGNLEVFDGWKWRISGTRLDHVNGSHLTGFDSVKKTAIGRVEATVEATHQDLAHLRRELMD